MEEEISKTEVLNRIVIIQNKLFESKYWKKEHADPKGGPVEFAVSALSMLHFDIYYKLKECKE